MASRKSPELPPRSSSVASYTSDSSVANRPRADTVHLTPQYTPISPPPRSPRTGPYFDHAGFEDLRSSSTQSLTPQESAGDRRILLLVYIHGFMGTDTSFKSFPAHVHNLLTISLADTHVVHSKIYPRYRSRKDISYARDAFSTWLKPHESDVTDVVLIGHSLGGILAAEVVLLPNRTPGSDELLQHRILGHIAYDTPFLGMHPRVVKTGLASLFRPKPGSPEPSTPQPDSGQPLSQNPFDEMPADPNYNPTYTNDVQLADRGNKFTRAFYFLNKHYGEWTRAASDYVKSHLEFGGCLADYPALKKRYASFRPLEDIKPSERRKSVTGKLIPRVRFVNYYTASTGRIRSKHLTQQEGDGEANPLSTTTTNLSITPSATSSRSPSIVSTPRISLEEHIDTNVVTKDITHLDLGEAELNHESPRTSRGSPPRILRSTTDSVNPKAEEHAPAQSSDDSERDSPTSLKKRGTDTSSIDTASALFDPSFPLPPLPPPPIQPPPFDAELYKLADPNTIKIARKEHERLDKVYQKQKKEHDKLVAGREKLIAKQSKAQKKAQKQSALPETTAADVSASATNTTAKKSKSEQAKIDKEREKEAEIERERVQVERELAQQRALAHAILAEQQNQAERQKEERRQEKQRKQAPPGYEEAVNVSVIPAGTNSEMHELEMRQRVIAHQLRAEAALTNNDKNQVFSSPSDLSPQSIRDRAIAHQRRIEAAIQADRARKSGVLSPSLSSDSSSQTQTHRSSTSTPALALSSVTTATAPASRNIIAAPSTPSDRKFCALPSTTDPAWIRVFMHDMDEVVAHTSLFLLGEAYARLVGDTAGRIERWLREQQPV